MNLNSISISEENLKLVKSILKKHLPSDVLVWCFGSRAKNCAKKYSDLDLALEYNSQKIPFELMASLKNAFEESDLPWKVDLVDMNAISDDFKAVVKKDRILLK